MVNFAEEQAALLGEMLEEEVNTLREYNKEITEGRKTALSAKTTRIMGDAHAEISKAIKALNDARTILMEVA